MHTPITIQDLSIQFQQKLCFADFSQLIHAGDRIAIIGNNGAGKSSLLKAMAGLFTDYDGLLKVPKDVELGYIEQLLPNDHDISGGECFMHAFYHILAAMPNCLLLDEPTNHLDATNRKELIEQIRYFYGTVVVVTHDVALMDQCFDKLWHIDNGVIKIFSGKYSDYAQQRLQQQAELSKQLKGLNKDKKAMHTKLMQEQQRAARSSAQGAKSINNKKWATVVSHAKARRAQETSGKKKIALQTQKQSILDRLDDLNAPPPIKPTFYMPAQSASGVLLQINNGGIGYGEKTVLSNIHLTMHNHDKAVLAGANGSGKTTLLKAIRQDASVQRTGEWQDLNLQAIGYLDQHYQQLPKGVTVLEALTAIVPDWDPTQCYRHLAEFLFKGHDCVHQSINHLSGGEKARLSLALIAAKPPKLLILDEVTNNVDLETINYLIQILADYPGAMLIISHNQYFVEQLPITKIFSIDQGLISEQ